MTKYELSLLLDEMAEIYPRFSTSEKASAIWFKHLCKYEIRHARAAFERYTQESNTPPTVADIKAHIQAVVGNSGTMIAKSRWTRPYKRIDFCMDMLKPEFDNDELKLMFGASDMKTCLSLVGRTDWIQAYKAKLNEMTQFACQKWLEGDRPEYQFTGTEDQCAWSLDDIPVFDDDRMFFTGARNV